MSGDVQPRKRKEKRRKKEDSEEITSNFSVDEHIHVHKDASTGGNICTKILFFLLSFVLLVMVGLVLLEYRGFSDDEALVPVSKWASTFDGWLDETPRKHDDHTKEDSGEHGHAESGDQEDESEAVSKEASEEEERGIEEEETEHAEEEEDEEEEEEEEDIGDKSEEDKLEDEESEEKGGLDEDETEEENDEDETDEEYGKDETEEEDGEDEEDRVPYRQVHRYSYKEIGKDIIDDDISDEGGDDNDLEESEEEETGRDEPDDDVEEKEHSYGRESDENEDDLHEIPGIKDSAEDEEGGNIDEALHEIPGVSESAENEDDEGESVEQSGETVTPQRKSDSVHQQSKEVGSGEEVYVKKRESIKQVGDEISNVKTSDNKIVEEEEDEEPEPSGVALKFGVGVALVIVAHVVLVRKWNSDDNIASPEASNVVQSEPQHETPQAPKPVPQITVEQEIEKESEEMGYVHSDYITRRQTLLPEDLVHGSTHRELEETDSSVPSEEEVDDDQEELVFKQNVYKAENAFKLPQRDEKPFSVEKSYKQQSFEELMKKYHELTPEGSESESEEEQEDEEEEEDDDGGRELNEDELVDEDDLDNEDEDIEEDILQNKLLETKTITHPDAESKTPAKAEQKMMQARVGNAGKQQELVDDDEDEDLGQLQQEEEEDEEEELASEDESFNEKFRQYEFSKSRQPEKASEDSGSEKEMPVAKSKIPKNMGGQNAQVYSKADITNIDDWKISQELDAADDDAEEGLNF